MYVHSPDELPSISSLKLDVPGSDYERHFYVEVFFLAIDLPLLRRNLFLFNFY